jgi:hypothetical protein
MKNTCCPSCDARLSAAELNDGWCESCGKKVPAWLAARGADHPERAVEARPASPAPAGEKMTTGQKVLVGLFCLAVLALIGGALLGDPKAIRGVAKIGGILAAGVVLGVLAWLWGLVRGKRE